MRIAFMGSPEFAVPALQAIHRAGHVILAVYCQPPRPAGRGHSIRQCPVHVAASALGLPVRTPERLRNHPSAVSEFASHELDAAVVLPQAMLDAPLKGCLNIHASLLPRWRGAAPIQAAVLAGDAETGITIMQMEAGLDTGPMLLRQSVPITQTTTTSMLHDSLAAIGAELILTVLAGLPEPIPQDEAAATYFPKLSREDGRIVWTQTAAAIDRQIRALNPWPGTFTTLDGKPLKIIAGQPVYQSGPPGTVLDQGLTVACGHQAIRLTAVQAPGRGVMTAEAFLRGHRVEPGTQLGP